MLISLSACSETQMSDRQEQGSKDNGEVIRNSDSSILIVEKSSNGADIRFSEFPSNISDFEKIDMTDEYSVAAATILALILYEKDPDTALDCLDLLNGPDEIGSDKAFIKEQFSQYPYVARSYLTGAEPANDYRTENKEIIIEENSYSRSEDGYVTLWIECGGADSNREIKLKRDEAAGEWYLYSYSGILEGVKDTDDSDVFEEETQIRPVYNDTILSTGETASGNIVSSDFLPDTLDEFRHIDITDEYKAAAATVMALAIYETDPERSLEILEYLNGNSTLSSNEKNLISEQFSQYPYVMRSYFEGAVPENNYKPTGFSLDITENGFSRLEDGFVTLWITSNGADFPREMTLKQKASTGEWFVTSFTGLLSGVRMPADIDVWNGNPGSAPASYNDTVLKESETDNGKTVKADTFPKDISDFKKIDITDEYKTAAAAVLALALYETSPEKAIEILDYLTGPEGLSAYDKSFIKNQFDQYPYVMRSYFTGSAPENNYTPKEYSLDIFENAYSRTEDGYVTLWITCGGADSPREIILRNRKSTGEWFVNAFGGLLSGIRLPADSDIWNGNPGASPAKYNDTVLTAKDIGNGKSVSAKTVPGKLEEYKKIDITDEYKAAAAAVMALSVYETEPEKALEILGYLMGPEELSAHDRSFIKNQFDQYPYVARSYFEGAVPENDYTPASYTLKITENSYSRTEDGFCTLWISSGGADSPREITLRNRKSTGEWFVIAYGGLISGIRLPAEADVWNGNPGSAQASFNDRILTAENIKNGKKVSSSSVPTKVSDYKNIDLTDEYKAAAAVVMALSLYENDPDLALEIIEYLMGPESVSNLDKSFIRDQFGQYPYVIRSYFEGACPENDYTPASWTLEITENAYSRVNENYVVLHVSCGGADSPRSVTLRKQLSTGCWYVNAYKGLLSGVEMPAEADVWNGHPGSSPASFNDKLLSTEKIKDGKKVSAGSVPSKLEDYMTIDITDEYKAAAAAVMALSLYETDDKLAYEILDYLLGPESLSVMNKNFIRDQLRQYPYNMRSYFEGATPENGYEPAHCTLTVTENSYSRTTENYVVLYVTSGGADTPRSIKLRKQLSTGCWFVDSFNGLLAGVKDPE